MNHDMAEKKPSSEDVERAAREAFAAVCRATLGTVCSYSVLVRRLLAFTLRMVAPDAPVEPPTDREWRIAATNAVHEMYASLGVPIGQAPPTDLREQVREAFNFREPPAPEWVCSGAMVRSSSPLDRSICVVEAVCRSDGNAVVQLASRRHGEPGEQIPMGLFLAQYVPVAESAPAKPATIIGTADAEPTLHFTGTLDDVRRMARALSSAVATGMGEARGIFGVPQLLFVCQGSIANQPELIPGGFAFVAKRAALADVLTVVESLSATKTRGVVYAKLGSFERMIVEVREVLRGVEGVREVSPAVIGDGARVEATSMQAADDVRRVLLAAGWSVTEIAWVTMVRRKGDVG